MLGLLGMESTSFLEELSRTDDVTSVPTRGGAGTLANGTMVPQEMSSAATVEMQQRMPQQASWGVNQLPPHGGAAPYQNAEYVQYNAAKHHQRMGHVSGYAMSGLMPAGNSGSVHGHSNTAQYGYSGMPNVAGMAPPRQGMSSSAAAWNHSPGSGGVPSDALASPSYTGMTGQHVAMAQPQQHRANVAPQMQISTNRSNSMQAQMYSGQYHDFAAAGGVQQSRMMGYSDQQSQMQEMAMPGGYRQPMSSPPPASSRLMQMSGQAAQMPNQVHYQQQQQQQPRYAGVESSHYVADSQSHHTGTGHMMGQYQYNAAMMQGQPRMHGDGYGQFYAQPLYRMSAYGASSQAQMMSPNAMAQMSPQARSSVAARPPDMRSPQPAQVPPRPGAVSIGGVPTAVGSTSFKPNVPGHTATYTVASNSTTLVPPQRMTSVDSVKVVGPSVMPAAASLSAQQPLSSTRYAVPGYQTNMSQNLSSMPGIEMRQQQLYPGLQQQVMDVPERSHCFPQSHSQSYYQPVTMQQHQQQSQYATAAAMMSPGQVSQMAQPQQQHIPTGKPTVSSVSLVRY